MNIIIDSNVLFSALIKKSATRKIILDYDGYFLFPSFVFMEMELHKNEIVRKSGMVKKDFDGLLGLLLRRVLVIPDEVILPYRKKANEIVKSIDPDDAVFIACALAFPNSVVWSDDKRLKRQTEVRIMNTSEIITSLKDDA